VDQQAVVGQESGEQQSMPLLKRALGRKQIGRTLRVTELAALRSKTSPKHAIVLGEM